MDECYNCQICYSIHAYINPYKGLTQSQKKWLTAIPVPAKTKIFNSYVCKCYLIFF